MVAPRDASARVGFNAAWPQHRGLTNFINLAGSLAYTFAVPYAAIALTLYYFDEARGMAELPARAGLAGRLPRLPRAIPQLSECTRPVDSSICDAYA